MPIYEYACAACGHRFEEWQKMTDKPVKVCPKCKAKKVEKQISQTSFHLKGGGWYSDLYAGPKPSASTEQGSSTDSSSKDSSSKDSSSKETKSAPTSTKKATKGKKSEGAA